MKNGKKITRLQLKTDVNDEYTILAIVSAEPDYRLSLILNNELGISLKNTKPVEIKTRQGKSLYFSKFSYTEDSNDITYNLIANKSDKDYLLKKFSKIDYFLQIISHGTKLDTGELTSTIRKISTITALFIINPGEISDKNLQFIIS